MGWEGTGKGGFFVSIGVLSEIVCILSGSRCLEGGTGPCRLGFPPDSVGGMKASSRVGLDGSARIPPTGVAGRRGLGGGGNVLPSMTSGFETAGRGDLCADAWRSFSLILSATVPDRLSPAVLSLACAGLGEEVYGSGEEWGGGDIAGANLALISAESLIQVLHHPLVLALISCTRLDLIRLLKLRISLSRE
jgi:hypothetical protein